MFELTVHFKHEMIEIWQKFQRNFELTVFELTVPDLWLYLKHSPVLYIDMHHWLIEPIWQIGCIKGNPEWIHALKKCYGYSITFLGILLIRSQAVLRDKMTTSTFALQLQRSPFSSYILVFLDSWNSTKTMTLNYLSISLTTPLHLLKSVNCDTRMHSSKMRTVRCIGHLGGRCLPGGVCFGGVCLGGLPRGSVCPGGVYPGGVCQGECLPRGDVCPGVSA